MKKRRIIVGIILTLVLIIAVSFSSIFEIEAQAASKKKKTVKKVSAEEQQVIDLTTYRDSLIKQGADQASIDFANQALAIATSAWQMAQQAEQAKATAAQANQVATAVFPVIFVGDSRMVQMHEALGNTGVYYVAENSKGYNWFVEQGVPQIDAHVGKGTKIVINFGVNDPGNIDKYISYVNTKSVEWRAKGAKVYYATVNPVSENPYTSEAQVNYFNDKLVPGLIGVGIIDTNAYLRTNGYRLVDGLHYDGPTYFSLYNYIMSRI